MLSLAVVQFCPDLGNSEKNLRKIVTFSENLSSDIILFPELATSGYFFQSKEEAKLQSFHFMSAEIQQFQKISSKQNKIIAFGFPEEDKNKIYNSSAVFFPNSNISFVYRKTHLFYKERFCFDEGDSGFITRYDNERDINIGCMICYDWRFPEAARTLALQGSDLILCPSNLVTNVWTKVMPARSLENKVYLAVANRFGTEMKEDESLHFNGLSSIYAYNGDLLSQASADNEEIIYAEIFPDKTRNKQFNEINDIFADRRADMYKL